MYNTFRVWRVARSALLLLVAVGCVAVSLFVTKVTLSANSSPEENIGTLSPLGERGGIATPASGSSFACTLTLTPNGMVPGATAPVTLSWVGGLSSMNISRMQSSCDGRASCWTDLGQHSSGWADTSVSGLSERDYTYRVREQTLDGSGHPTDLYECYAALSVRSDPDLLSKDLQIQDGSSIIVQGVPVVFSAAVENIGNENAGAFRDAFSFRYGSNSYNTFSTVDKGGLLAGQSSPDVSGARTFNTLGNVTIRHCVDDRNNVPELSGVNNCSTRTYQVVATAALPDLVSENLVVVGGVTTVPVNTTVSFTARARNASANPLTGTFSDRFQYSSDAGATWLTMTVPPATTNLAANGTTASESGSFTPLSVGTYKVRHCADEPGNAIIELNESNNCTPAGAEVTITTTPTGPGPSVSCSVVPTSISTGGSATWTAVPAGGTAPLSYQWSGTDGLTGSAISINKTYNTPGTKSAWVNVIDDLGLQSGQTACSNTVIVGDGVANVPTASLEARIAGGTWVTTPINFVVGQNIELKWTSTDATTCVGDANFNTGGASTGTDVNVTEPSVVQSPRTYTITCTGPGGTMIDTIEASAVNTTGPIIVSCTSNPLVAAVNVNIHREATAVGGTGVYTDWAWRDGGSGSLNDGFPTNDEDYQNGNDWKEAYVQVRDSNGVWSPEVQCPDVFIYDLTPPDLTISNPTLSCGSSCAANDLVTFASIVTRTGGPTENATGMRFELDLNRDGSLDFTPLTTAGLGAGFTSGVNVNSNANLWTAVNGSHRVRAVIDRLNTVPESDENNNYSQWVNFSVGAVVGSPDVVVTNPVVSGSGSTRSFRSTATNVGGTISATFSNRFVVREKNAATCGASTAPDQFVTAEDSTNPMNTDATQDIDSTAVWSATVGIEKYCVKAEVDLPLLTNGVVAESDENNNESGWSMFTVPADPMMTPSATLEVKKSTDPDTAYTSGTLVIGETDQITLRWTSSDADTCSSADFPTNTGNPNPPGTRSGTQNNVTEPPADGNPYQFQIVCTNTGPGTGVDSVTIVRNPPPDVPILTLNPKRVRQGDPTDPVTIDADPRGQEPCTLLGDDVGGPGVDTVAVPGPGVFSTQVVLNGETTFTLDCRPQYPNLISQTARILPILEEI